MFSGFIRIIILCSVGTVLFIPHNKAQDPAAGSQKMWKEDTSGVGQLLSLSKEKINAANYDSALHYAEMAYALSAKLEDPIGRARSLHCLGIVDFNKGNYDEALHKYDQSFQLSRECLYKQGMADAHSSMGNVYEAQGNYVKALQSLRASLDLNSELKNKANMANVHNNIGIVFFRQNALEQAMEHYKIALKIREETGDRKSMASSYNNIGNVCLNQGRFSEALDNYYTALKINQELGRKKNVANAYLNIGNIFDKQGNFRESLENSLEALNLFGEIGNKRGMANAYLNIASAYIKLNEEDSALKYNVLCLDLSRSIGDKRGISDAGINIGVIYQNKGVDCLSRGDSSAGNRYLEEAILNFQSSLAIKKEIGDQTGIVYSSLNIGNIYSSMNRFDESRVLLNHALEIASGTGDRELLLDCYQDLSLLDSTQASSPLTPDKDRALYWKNAYDNYKLYAELGDSLLNESTNNKMSELQAAFKAEKKEKEIQLLNKENELKAAALRQVNSLLLASQFEETKKKQELQLMNQSNKIKELQLSMIKDDYQKAEAESNTRAAELVTIKKDKALQAQLLEKQKLQRNYLFTAVAMLILVAGLFFNRYQLRRKIDQQEAVFSERKRISSDMHDDLASGLTSIRLLSEMAKHKSNNHSEEIKKISLVAENLMDSLHDIIWVLSAENNSMENLVFYIRQFAGEFLDICQIGYKFEIPDFIPSAALTVEQKRNIFLSVKESLHNIAKHADASAVTIRITFDREIGVTITDNGRGIDVENLNGQGNGLRNIRNRMESIHGSFSFENESGTTIRLSCPLS